MSECACFWGLCCLEVVSDLLGLTLLTVFNPSLRPKSPSPKTAPTISQAQNLQNRWKSLKSDQNRPTTLRPKPEAPETSWARHTRRSSVSDQIEVAEIP